MSVDVIRYLVDDPDDLPDEDVLREFLSRESEVQAYAEHRVRGILVKALEVAHGMHWHWGSGDPAVNVRDALDDLIRERYSQPEAPTYRKQRIPPALRKAVLERDAYRCRICLTWIDLAVDHVYPESLGGPTELDNLQALCKPCNSRKGARV